MTYVIFAFRSRTQSMSFHERLTRRGVRSALINTPREVSVGCGLSVKLGRENFETAAAVQKESGLNTFLGAYLISTDGRRLVAERIYF